LNLRLQIVDLALYFGNFGQVRILVFVPRLRIDEPGRHQLRGRRAAQLGEVAMCHQRPVIIWDLHKIGGCFLANVICSVEGYPSLALLLEDHQIVQLGIKQKKILVFSEYQAKEFGHQFYGLKLPINLMGNICMDINNKIP
jgi:hypothetical protein